MREKERIEAEKRARAAEEVAQREKEQASETIERLTRERDDAIAQQVSRVTQRKHARIAYFFFFQTCSVRRR